VFLGNLSLATVRRDVPHESARSRALCCLRFRKGHRKLLNILSLIPDPDVRLFAEIEFIAALVGLPQFAGSRRVPAANTAFNRARSAMLIWPIRHAVLLRLLQDIA
jgi:hypothetical protein